MGAMKESETLEQEIAIVRAVTGVDEATARFIIAIEKGEIDGDVEEEP